MRLTRRAVVAAILSLAAGGLAIAAPAAATPVDPPPSTSPAELADARTLTPGSGPVSFALVVPITVPVDPQGTGLIDGPTLATETGVGGILARELDAVTGTAAVLAVDPMVVASIRVLGSAAPPSATAWLAQLEALPNEKFPLAYADADPGLLARAGALDLLTGLHFTVDASNFGPSPTPSPSGTPDSRGHDGSTPSPTPTTTQPPGPPPLPSDADILAGDWVTHDIAWPAAGTVAGSELGPLARAGYRTVLVDSGNISTTSSALVSFGGIDGLVSDAGISALVRQATGAFGEPAMQDALTRLDTALQGMQAVAPGRGVVATLDRRWAVGPLHVRDVLQNVESQTSAQSVGITAILTGPKATAQLVDGSLPADGANLVGQLIATVPVESAFATIAGDRAADVTSPRRLELLSTLSVGWVETGDGWADRLRAYLASSTKLLDSVRIVHGSNQLVTATSSNIPVVVSNALPVPIKVLVTIDPSSGYLRMDKRQVPLTVEPSASGKALMGAQALSTYTLTAEITLHSAAKPSVQVGTPDIITVDLRPSWESIGTAVIVAIVVLIFGGGIVRQVLKRRKARRRRAADASGASEIPAPGDEDEG